MKLTLVYDKDDHKLQDTSYSWIYKGMLDALANHPGFEVTHVHDDCYVGDIDADAIIFYDVHATHHIRIDGIETHPAVKMEYVSDPNQNEVMGRYKQFDKPFHKLGIRQRVGRFFDRGIRYVICPFKAGYYEWMGDILGSDADDMLLYFPLAPTVQDVGLYSLVARNQTILGNGAVADGGKHIYDFRKWAFEQPEITHIPHWIADKSTPSGQEYMGFISKYAGALALHDYFPVPKYFEIPMAGCVTFAQYYEEYEELGFKDMESCVYLDKENFRRRTQDFLNEPNAYQSIADAGRKLMEENYTADHFAEFIHTTLENAS